ncbi:MAG: PleD family two-component response regulator [Oceanospirillaceae bacterium]
MGIAKLQDEDLLNLINKADVALYQAKNTGRNKIVIAQ